MLRIEKQPNFFKKNALYLYGGFHLLLGIIYNLVSPSDSMPKFYMVIGVVAIIIGFFRRNKTQEFIELNDKEVTLSDYINSRLKYSWDEVDDVLISEKQITIKSGSANGMMYDLKGYSKADIEMLKTEVYTRYFPKTV